jgi:hypothetical protein
MLVGEVKWKDSKASDRDIERWFTELSAKGAPPVVATSGQQIAWALFVPEPGGREPQLPKGFRVISAEDVVNDTE